MLDSIRQFKKTGDCSMGFKNYLEVSNEKSLAYFLNQIPDVRRNQGKRYPLLSILAIVLWGYMSSLGSIRSIQSKARAYQEKHPEICLLLGIEQIPSHSTISRVLNLIDPRELNRAFLNWMNANQSKLSFQLAIDGKANRALTDKAHGKKRPPYLINVVETATRQLIFQMEIPDKLSEISVVPEVIRYLKENYPELIEGMTLSTDALSTQPKTIEACKEANVALVSPLKNNHSELLKGIQKQAKTYLEKNCLKMKEEQDYVTTFTKAHGRIERRNYIVIPVDCVDEGFEEIECVCQVTRYRKEHSGTDKHSIEKTFYQSTVMLDANEFSDFIKQHWQVEVYHNYLDTKTKEDQSTSKGNAFPNCSLLRKASLNLVLSIFLNQEAQTYNNLSDNFLFDFQSAMDVVFGV